MKDQIRIYMTQVVRLRVLSKPEKNQVYTCLESLWPYKVKRLNKCPSDEAHPEAQVNIINDALQIKIDLYETTSCFAQGFPVCLILNCINHSIRQKYKGILPMPKLSDKNRQSQGRFVLICLFCENYSLVIVFSHVMLAVG